MNRIKQKMSKNKILKNNLSHEKLTQNTCNDFTAMFD